ncbi:MAG: hypothetical protein LBG89_03425 [Rickettsiales bacterium]|jgi:hypothetical protein|nr:hypothetical protein [Rickettsiales bacterium]
MKISKCVFALVFCASFANSAHSASYGPGIDFSYGILEIIKPAGDVDLAALLNSTGANELYAEDARLAFAIDDNAAANGFALKLDSAQLNRITFVLNISASPAMLPAGTFITIFEAGGYFTLNRITFEIDLPEFYSVSLTKNSDGAYGILIEQNNNYTGGGGNNPGHGPNPRSDYLTYVAITNPQSWALRRLSGAPDPDTYEKIAAEFFHMFQGAALDMSSAAQRSFRNAETGTGDYDGYKLFAETFRVSAAGGQAYGAAAGASGIFSVYSALSSLNYADGSANGKILGARLAPRVSLGQWTLKAELGYQSAWFDEGRNSFGLNSDNNMRVESKIAGAGAEYKIQLGKSLALTPVLRYGVQESVVRDHGDDLFFSKRANREIFSTLDSGGKFQYKACVVSTCHHLGLYALGGYDFYEGAPVWSYGAYAKFSVDSDMTWLDFHFGSERFGEKDSYLSSVKLRLVF